MTTLFIVLPLAFLVAGGAVAAFAWVVRSGQLDDLETPPRRILYDDGDLAIDPLASYGDVSYNAGGEPAGPGRR